MTIEEIKNNYQNYRWFFTSNGKLVVGGKSSSQNEELVKRIIDSREKLLMLHTASPGSPFSVILEDIDNVDENDLEEAAIFTACFSQQWKKGREEVKVNVFTSDQVEKREVMKEGTFGVVGKEEGEKAKLKLYLKEQEDKLRAVPFETGGIYLTPGKMSKDKAVGLISKKLNLKKEEVLQALPAGGFNIHLKNE